MTKFPEYVRLHSMELKVSDDGHVAIKPFLPTHEGPRAAMPCHLVLTQQQARELAQDLLDAADQCAEQATASRN